MFFIAFLFICTVLATRSPSFLLVFQLPAGCPFTSAKGTTAFETGKNSIRVIKNFIVKAVIFLFPHKEKAILRHIKMKRCYFGLSNLNIIPIAQKTTFFPFFTA